MIIKRVVEAIEMGTPTIEELSDCLGEEIALFLLPMWQFSNKEDVVLSKENEILAQSYSVIKFISFFELKRLRVMDLSFFENPIVFNEFLRFAGLNGDHLVIDTLDHKIKLYDNYQNEIKCNVALNSDKFLEALIKFFEISKRIFINTDNKNKIDLNNLSNECSTAAGGIEYKVFFNILFGLSQ